MMLLFFFFKKIRLWKNASNPNVVVVVETY